MAERDYVLGTHDAELERLGLQHRLWRPRVLDGWRRGRHRGGPTGLGVGAGPGGAAGERAGGPVCFPASFDSRGWALAPPCAPHARFVDQVMASWRADGGEPDIGRLL